MIEEEKVTKTVTVTVKTYTCDLCGKKVKTAVAWKKCEVCGNLFCRDCYSHFDWDILEKECYDGDYPSAMCHKCWDIGEPYIKKIKELSKEYDEKNDELIKEWESKCKE